MRLNQLACLIVHMGGLQMVRSLKFVLNVISRAILAMIMDNQMIFKGVCHVNQSTVSGSK